MKDGGNESKGGNNRLAGVQGKDCQDKKGYAAACLDKRPEGRESEEKRMDKLRMAEANYKSYTPINGVVEPDFLEYLKETFRKWQQYHEEGVTLGSREIAKLSNVVEGARINSRFGFEKFANRFTDEEGEEWFSLMIYKNREEMEIDAEPLYCFASRIHR
jgi:hypothetical protein